MSVNIYTAAGLKKIAGSGFMDAELNANSNNGVKNSVLKEKFDEHDGAIAQINTDLSHSSAPVKIGTWVNGKSIYRVCIQETFNIQTSNTIFTELAGIANTNNFLKEDVIINSAGGSIPASAYVSLPGSAYLSGYITNSGYYLAMSSTGVFEVGKPVTALGIFEYVEK